MTKFQITHARAEARSSFYRLSRRPARRAVLTQVGFAEFNNTADNRANIGGTIIGAPIVG